MFHKLLINKTTHSFVSEFFLHLLMIYIYLTLCLQDEGNMTVLLRLAFTTRIPQDIFVTWRNVFTSDFVTNTQPNLWDFSFMCLVSTFRCKNDGFSYVSTTCCSWLYRPSWTKECLMQSWVDQCCHSTLFSHVTGLLFVLNYWTPYFNSCHDNAQRNACNSGPLPILPGSGSSCWCTGDNSHTVRSGRS